MRLTCRAPSAHRGRSLAWGTARDARRGTGWKGRTIGCLALSLGAASPSARAHAQSRELKVYGPGAPEAKLMLYYSSTIAFSPVGVPFGVERPSAMAVATARTSSRVEAALEVSYLPPLSVEQRTAGTDKPEATNLAPLFARPRVGARLPLGVGLELSWIPPVQFFDVKANLVAGAVSRAFTVGSLARVIARASVLTGRVEGAITCNRKTANDGNVALATYFSFVCHSNNSRDFFDPRHVSGELMIARRSEHAAWQPYLAAGARAERTRFDIGVIRRDGSRDPDEPVLQVTTTRAYGTAGASWLGLARTRLAGELYYAPGSALTGRVLAGVRLW